jgi:hypothetical protein
MIRQVADPVRFTDASHVVVALASPSSPQTTVVMSVVMTGGHIRALRVTDNTAAPRWRQANDDGRTSRWYRHPEPRGAVTEITLETVNEQPITGTCFVAEFVGLSVGEAVQQLDDLIAEVA